MNDAEKKKLSIRNWLFPLISFTRNSPSIVRFPPLPNHLETNMFEKDSTLSVLILKISLTFGQLAHDHVVVG